MLTGGDVVLSIPSVGATENAMLAAVAAAGTTTITNAAREPEIVDLQEFLRTLGAKVRGAGSSVITVEGGKPLHGGEFTVMGDRIVAATYLAAAACARRPGEGYGRGLEASVHRHRGPDGGGVRGAQRVGTVLPSGVRSLCGESARCAPRPIRGFPRTRRPF